MQVTLDTHFVSLQHQTAHMVVDLNTQQVLQQMVRLVILVLTQELK